MPFDALPQADTALDLFFQRLELTPRQWRTMIGGSLRLVEGNWMQCPISAVTGEGGHYGVPWDASACLGLTYEEIGEIVLAADNTPVADPDMRLRLLRACGLPCPTVRSKVQAIIHFFK